MAEMNPLVKKGFNPMWQVYELPISKLEKLCVDLINDRYGIPAMVNLWIDGGDFQDEKVVIAEVIIPEHVDEDEPGYVKMIDDGLNPNDDSDSILHFLTFELVGGRDAFIEYADQQFVKGGLSPQDFVRILTSPPSSYGALLGQLERTMETALNEGRDETIAEVGKAMKVLRGEAI